MSEQLPYPSIVTTRTKVKNLFPIIEPSSYRIAVIGEAPGEQEEGHGFPFVGPSGNLLNSLLQASGIDRKQIFLGNVCQYRPAQNKIATFDWNGEEIQSGLHQLKLDLNAFDPNICVLLGNTPLRSAKGGIVKISSWRGSLFLGNDFNSPFFNRKCIPSYHPAYVLRDFTACPLLRFDLGRARGEGGTKSLDLPRRELITNLDATQLCHLMDTWPSGLRCSIDIEGGLPHYLANDGVKKDAKKRRHLGWRCVSICGRPTKSFTIAWWKFSEIEHIQVLKSFARLMFRVDVPKVLQNSLYDSFVMAYGWGILIRNVAEDTMLKSWEIYSELPKKLSVQASIWTREPHWKDEEMYESDGEGLAIGCAKDTAVTLEICQAQDNDLLDNPLGKRHYRTNVELLNPAHFMELRGIRYDRVSADKRLKEVSQTGWTETKKDGVQVFHSPIAQVGEELCKIAGSELRGEKGSLSSQRLTKYLYETKGYPPQYKKDKETGFNKLTSDAEAILNLRKKFPDDNFLKLALRHRHLEGLIETLNVKTDADGRVRCAYNVVGTETGRFSCKTSPTGAGANLTTITKQLRYNYTADPGYDFAQCDLEGADGWTIAARCASLGDDRMLRDYREKLKPAKILAMMYLAGESVNSLDYDTLRFWSSEKGGFKAVQNVAGYGIYDGAKATQHGTNYLMGIPTVQKTLMLKSFKITGNAIYLPHSEAATLQRLYHLRYFGVRRVHQWAESEVRSKGYQLAATGHTRIYFGRRYGTDINETVRQFLADEPQQNTTWATNLAMLALWKDPANRVVFRRGLDFWTADGTQHRIPEWTSYLYNRITPGSLVIEPLHQVHDALCAQWPCFLRDWARAKMKTYFNNPMEIAGTVLTIPFDGNYGPSWGEQPYHI